MLTANYDLENGTFIVPRSDENGLESDIEYRFGFITLNQPESHYVGVIEKTWKIDTTTLSQQFPLGLYTSQNAFEEQFSTILRHAETFSILHRIDLFECVIDVLKYHLPASELWHYSELYKGVWWHNSEETKTHTILRLISQVHGLWTEGPEDAYFARPNTEFIT
jgi:hypothetical protein